MLQLKCFGGYFRDENFFGNGRVIDGKQVPFLHIVGKKSPNQNRYQSLSVPLLQDLLWFLVWHGLVA